MRQRRRAQTLIALGLGISAALIVGLSPGASADAPNLGYARDVNWHLDGAPEVAAMESTVRSVLSDVHLQFIGADGQPIDGFYPGPTYSFLRMYIRDTATDLPMVRYYYGATALRSSIEEFLREQYPDGSVSATISPDHKVDKATVVSDEETSAIVDAVEAYDAMPDPAWLNQSLRGLTLIERLNRAMNWVLTVRRDPDTQLIKRAHTTDWGDIKWEPDSDPSHMDPGDQWTVSIYDQSIGYAALQGLARLNAAAGRDADRARWEAEAANLKAATNLVLWQDDPTHGFYRIHKHLSPNTVVHDLPEDDVIAIGNAAAIYYGLADPDKVPRILAALERARIAVGAPKPGLSLEPAYDNWHQVEMDQRTYQNGALWDWWAGRQISAEFSSGYSRMARDHMLMVARDWAAHPGKVREWESPSLNRTGADQAYAGAAAVMGQSVVDGLFGVRIVGQNVSVTPRLDDMNGGVRVYEPATDLYVAYEYQATDRGEAVQYGSNSSTALSLHLPVRWQGDSRARLDGKDYLPVSYQRIGQTLLASVVVPGGQHQVELFRVP
ncbi:MAG: hypothetical protein JO352_36890, partial [Chloroflexi bacterium]|nr:hypothetical protein [Chloroflexota bacterium]